MQGYKIQEDIFQRDRTDAVLDFYFTKLINANNPAALVSVDDTTITVPTTMNFVVGNIANIFENGRTYQGEVLAVSVDAPNDTLTLDTPFDFAFTAASDIERTTKDMNVDGSSTPQIFSLKAPLCCIWDITRIIFNMTDNVIMDSAKFGGISALTNGIVVRRKNGVYNNMFNVKSNGEMAVRLYDVEYDSKAPAGVYGLRGRRTFNGQSKNGVVVRLEGNDDDELQIIIQDDLTDLSSFEFIGQGHEFEE